MKLCTKVLSERGKVIQKTGNERMTIEIKGEDREKNIAIIHVLRAGDGYIFSGMVGNVQIVTHKIKPNVKR